MTSERDPRCQCVDGLIGSVMGCPVHTLMSSPPIEATVKTLTDPFGSRPMDSHTPSAKRRKSYLLMTDFDRLSRWARQASLTFGEMSYLVGSACEKEQYRDVDVRMILADARYDEWAERFDLRRLGLVVSVWGQCETGLPIDFQFQRMTEANAKYDGVRNAIGMASAPANSAEKLGWTA